MTDERTPEEGQDRAYCPAVDIYDTGEAVVLVADMPGVSEDGLSVKVEQNVLTITGEMVSAAEDPGQMQHCEFESGQFYRAFTLSDEADLDAIVAKFSAGVLVLEIPRRTAPPGRRIEVKVE